MVLFSPDLFGEKKNIELSEATVTWSAIRKLQMPKYGDFFQLLKVFSIPSPVGLKEGRVVDNGWKEGWEGPQKKSGEELGDDGILEEKIWESESEIPQTFIVTCLLKYFESHLESKQNKIR